MTDIEWREPPPDGRGNNGRQGGHEKHAAIAAELQSRPGEWAQIAADTSSSYGRLRRYRAYQPASAFEIVGRQSRLGHWDVYARYVGENGEHA
jgi:hypothetical protein